MTTLCSDVIGEIVSYLDKSELVKARILSKDFKDSCEKRCGVKDIIIETLLNKRKEDKERIEKIKNEKNSEISELENKFKKYKKGAKEEYKRTGALVNIYSEYFKPEVGDEVIETNFLARSLRKNGLAFKSDKKLKKYLKILLDHNDFLFSHENKSGKISRFCDNDSEIVIKYDDGKESNSRIGYQCGKKNNWMLMYKN